MGECSEGKKVSIEHTLVVSGVEVPEGTEPEKVREEAVRKGRIIRKMNCDGKEIEKEYDFEA